MKNEDAIAEFLLKEAGTKESLRKRISESAFDYYTGRYLFRLIVGLLIVGVLVYMMMNQNIPEWGVMALAMSGIVQMESKRNSGRIDAMVKLSNATESEPAGGDQ
jgi:NhaP-type Na+/H+ or K+/H+ antiporter